MLIPNKLDQFEWPGANHVLGIAGVGLGILAITIDVLWNDGAQLRRERQEQSRVGLRQTDHSGVFIWSLYGFDRAKHRLEGMVGLDRSDRKCNVLGRNRHTVMEGRVLDQVQCH